jgi:hypothetical protein
LSDALGNSILDESDEEILEDLRQAGVDPKAEALRLKTMMLKTVKTFQQRHLRAARAGYEKQAAQPGRQNSLVPTTAPERRELFSFLLQKPQYAALVTAQYRDLEAFTDNDIESHLEDLADLGVLNELNSERKDGKD